MAEDQARAGTVDREEIARFSRLAQQWWDPTARSRRGTSSIRSGSVISATGRPRISTAIRSSCSLAGLRVLDIGCGGGIFSEPLARLGARHGRRPPTATSSRGQHAAKSGLTIDYRNTTVEALAEAGESFDVVLDMEVVEHVAYAPLHGLRQKWFDQAG